MAIDPRLVEILRCPASGQTLIELDPTRLAAVNRAIAAGQARRDDGSVARDVLRAGLITMNADRVYRVAEGIPVMLACEALTLPSGGMGDITG
jgi:uncharacterized protein YbaR (Trm112 family)